MGHNHHMMTVLLLSVAVLAPMQEQIAARDSVNSLQCQAAAEIIRDIVLPAAQKIATRDFVFQQSVPIGSGIDSAMQNRFWPDSPGPPADLILRLEAQDDLDAVATCPEVQMFLDQKRVRFDQRSVERGSRLKRNLESHAIIYQTSLPVLSDDKKQALFMQNLYCGGRCASSTLVHATWTAGEKWVVVTEYMLSAS